MIYCDGVHLISDQGVDHLHAYAQSIGIKRCWFHSSSSYPHYDLPKSMRYKSLFFKQHPEIQKVDPRRIFEILRDTNQIKGR